MRLGPYQRSLLEEIKERPLYGGKPSGLYLPNWSKWGRYYTYREVDVFVDNLVDRGLITRSKETEWIVYLTDKGLASLP